MDRSRRDRGPRRGDPRPARVAGQRMASAAAVGRSGAAVASGWSDRIVRQPSLAASTRNAATRAGSPTEIDTSSISIKQQRISLAAHGHQYGDSDGYRTRRRHEQSMMVCVRPRALEEACHEGAGTPPRSHAARRTRNDARRRRDQHPRLHRVDARLDHRSLRRGRAHARRRPRARRARDPDCRRALVAPCDGGRTIRRRSGASHRLAGNTRSRTTPSTRESPWKNGVSARVASW